MTQEIEDSVLVVTPRDFGTVTAQATLCEHLLQVLRDRKVHRASLYDKGRAVIAEEEFQDRLRKFAGKSLDYLEREWHKHYDDAIALTRSRSDFAAFGEMYNTDAMADFPLVRKALEARYELHIAEVKVANQKWRMV